MNAQPQPLSIGPTFSQTVKNSPKRNDWCWQKVHALSALPVIFYLFIINIDSVFRLRLNGMWLMQVKIKCIGFPGNQLWNVAGYLDVGDSSGLGFMIYRAARKKKLSYLRDCRLPAGPKPLRVCDQIMIELP